MNNHGYSLLSMLLVLMMVSSFSLMVIKNRQELTMEHIEFMKEYLVKQSDSLLNNKENSIAEYDVAFNKKGHVNHAQTLAIGNHQIIIHLGNGYATVE